jgi:hypothetical protein
MEIVAWLITGIATLAAINFYMMWQKGITHSVNLTSLIVLILFDTKVFERESERVFDFARRTTYPNAGVLAGLSSTFLCDVATILAPGSLIAAKQRLWTLNQDAVSKSMAQISN